MESLWCTYTWCLTFFVDPILVYQPCWPAEHPHGFYNVWHGRSFGELFSLTLDFLTGHTELRWKGLAFVEDA